VLARLLKADTALSSELNELAHRHLKNWRGLDVAGLRPTAAIN
jgi:L-asparaginase II